MTKLHGIIKSLQDAQGSKAKQAILDANKDDELLELYMKATYDPAINYYITKVPVVAAGNLATMDEELIEVLLMKLSTREWSGDKAKDMLKKYNACLDEEGQELLKLLIKRSIGAGVGETMVLKTWPTLFFVPPYMRCSLMDDKIRAKFEEEEEMYVQRKADGSFAYLVVDGFGGNRLITRNGNSYPQEFADHFAGNLVDGVYIGELEVYAADGPNMVLCNRSEGNGILNAIMQGDMSRMEGHMFMASTWDYLSLDEFDDGESDLHYSERFDMLSLYAVNSSTVRVIETHVVKTLEEAYSNYRDYLSKGCEGAVLKTATHKWKDGTSKKCIKLKIEFDLDLKVTGYAEGTGKYVGMLGNIRAETSDGKIVVNIGSGFSDAQRKLYYDEPELILDKIVAVKANDIVTSEGRETYSLFLPIILEVRNDKKIDQADSYEKAVASLNAVKYGK